MKIATLEQFDAAQALDSGAIVMVWEDDNTACRVRRPSAQTTQWIQGATAAANAGRAFARKKPNLIDMGVAAAGLVVSAIQLLWNEQDDDFVGLVQREEVVNQSYLDATHAIIDQNQTIRGRLNIVKKAPQ